MEITTKVIETIKDKEVTQIRLINDNGVEAHLITLGATWQAFLVPQADGSKKNIVLGFDTPSHYNQNGIAAGQSIGRVAGRIKNGQFSISDQDYQVAQNNNGNALHGGPNGFHRQHWDYELVEDNDKIGVKFTYHAKEEIDDFPGDMTVTALYLLDNQNKLTVSYTATDVTKDTLFNPTNHVYFNLSDKQDLSSHELKINAEQVLESDDTLIPTGVKKEVAATPYDFRSFKPLIPAIEATGGIDDAFLVSSKDNQPIAVLRDKDSHDTISIYSDRNALVVYTFNFPEDNVYFSRDHGLENKKHEGVAMEAQTLPDAINHPDFGNTVIKKGETVTHSITFSYTKEI
ncbi:aldose epimerase family protein [Streptococcus zalophi]|uniref:Aldose 1-epimerase n=1 Tax=Streptococcus zalophi TaxID=640031 RepID=A0A934P934_9STRE|nr:aldose epimerase family protein [Streptococcus zalophi]MBJ8349288.1 galactose mutarotase [Streptococcus zalophi]